jgi:hypothetical protein
MATCYPEATNAVPAVVLRVSMLTEEEELFELDDDDDDELLGVLGGVWATPARPVLLLQGRTHSKPPPQGELNSDNDRWEECGMREYEGAHVSGVRMGVDDGPTPLGRTVDDGRRLDGRRGEGVAA